MAKDETNIIITTKKLDCNSRTKNKNQDMLPVNVEASGIASSVFLFVSSVEVASN